MTQLNIQIISAGAGSGKTYRLTQEMVRLLREGVRASGIIATTFTRKAAAELQERVRVKLLEEGMTEQADQLTNALIGTVHGLGVKLLRRFAFEAGVSPEVDIIADEDQQLMFNQALATVLTAQRVATVEGLSDRLGLHKREYYDWRKEVKQLTDIARANDFSIEVLERSKQLSFDSFREYLGPVSDRPAGEYAARLEELLGSTIYALEQNEDSTKKTASEVQTLKNFLRELKLRGELFWHQWVRIGKLSVGAKSRDDVTDLVEFALSHTGHPQFQQDIRDFIFHIFDIGIEALREYDRYKKERGLIDYTDMEVLIKRLLDHPQVQNVLREELDLLLVDEFQDTSPIQLEIFLRLSQFARHSIWVGDPKQSIYGFRGAEPRLMQAIVEQTGGIRPENIQGFSWRSREELVLAANAIFCKAFSELPEDQVALQPKRRKKADADTANKTDEPTETGLALKHWHFEYDGEGRPPGRPWMENCIAESIKQLLDEKIYVFPKDENAWGPAQPGDVAVLCRSNNECQLVAEALHRAGLKAAISRSGLVATAEAKLILACLKFILNQYDSLSIAEILLLAGGMPIEEIIESRASFLKAREEAQRHSRREAWAAHNPFIRSLNDLREQVVELSSAEILDLLLEELDLRRIIVSWGNARQRLNNIDALRKYALQYEEACNRLHTAASLGGLLLYLNELAGGQNDDQGSGEGPDTVQVLTYHKSKGLEWPIVLCHSLEGKLRAEVWGVEIIPETDTVDLDNILGNRWLRYWVNPYADQFRNTPLAEKIDAGTDKAQKTQQALQEEARLLYVGLTRARDYLIFPSGHRPTQWLNRVWHDGREDFPTLDHHTHESPWDWKGHFLDMDTRVWPYPRDFGYQETQQTQLNFQAPRAGRQPQIPYEIDLNAGNNDITANGRIINTKVYQKPLDLAEEENAYLIAKAVKAFLTADRNKYAPEDRQLMAAELLARFDISEDILESERLIQRADGWWEFLDKGFRVGNDHRKYPIRHHHGGRNFTTIADLVLESPSGLILIQYSGFPGDGRARDNKAIELAPWLYLTKTALQIAFNQPSVRTFVHFVLSGTLVELEVQSDGS
ncbi:UvrD-helicase domain-containing protein [Flavilitoribacter nigricans]|uniref:DNA 3'-5' helicase n=1 Tax=Flavilitoribacter nigricans (strain ATCC 23147 / DSM 23189 / NBRC 102662 / NCIMB 1420 / SS-2) TaxID=1122177 RepID=A0A2D0NCG5_FLAN2|nr:UvrD-helicase domain-containing protein [Flavilitoribacter nigricans]PHN06192.1 DNA helicase UvrD [Flavilitoribacter nigricans DSM 23189 = NBRC 102662]